MTCTWYTILHLFGERSLCFQSCLNLAVIFPFQLCSFYDSQAENLSLWPSYYSSKCYWRCKKCQSKLGNLKIHPRVHQLIVQNYLNEVALAVTSATSAFLFIKPQEFCVDDAVRLCCSFHVFQSLLHEAGCLSQLWAVCGVNMALGNPGCFWKHSEVSSSPLIYGLSQFLLVLFRWVFLVEQVFWFLFLSIKVVYATSKYKERIQHPRAIITKSPRTSLPRVQRCPLGTCTSCMSSSSVETQDS